jgi:lysophospholipase L1-like esterase
VISTTRPLSIEVGARIAILGGTLMERMQAHGWFEGMLFARFAAQQPVVRTLAWPGDELTVQPRPENYADMHEQLAEVKADVVLAGYGFNESFAGAAGVAKFEVDLAAFIAGLRAHRYNGKSVPAIVLISPIAHENLGNPNLPDGREGNARLRLYTEAMERVAKRERVGFVNVFTPALAAMEARKNAADNLTTKGAKGAKEDEVNLRKKEALTFNGIHLTDADYRQFGEMLFRGLFSETPKEVTQSLKESVEEKNRTRALALGLRGHLLPAQPARAERQRARDHFINSVRRRAGGRGHRDRVATTFRGRRAGRGVRGSSGSRIR